MEWKEIYKKNNKPSYSELLDYFPENIRSLFLRFDKAMNENFNLYNKWHRYENNFGWVYGYCRNYRFELLCVTVQSDYFTVLGVLVKDDESLKRAMEKAKIAYDSGFEERYEAFCAKRRANQIERSKKRVENEKLHMEKLLEHIDKKKFNQFKWSKKVSRNDLLRLYQSDAKGMLDEELLDDVGFTFYTRCIQAKKVRDLMDKGQMLCFGCESELQASTYTELTECSCGYSYTYREYRRSCNTANMPGGRATPIFNSFAEKWPSCKNTTAKMMLIDWLIHECHVTLMSGLKGRSVCVNLIDGTKKQIEDLILLLAYGNNSSVNT